VLRGEGSRDAASEQCCQGAVPQKCEHAVRLQAAFPRASMRLKQYFMAQHAETPPRESESAMLGDTVSSPHGPNGTVGD